MYSQVKLGRVVAGRWRRRRKGFGGKREKQRIDRKTKRTEGKNVREKVKVRKKIRDRGREEVEARN